MNSEAHSPIRNSRQAAYVAIEEYRSTGDRLGSVLDRLYRQSSLQPLDRGLATELACGVIRRLETLDCLLGQLVNRRLDQVEPPLLTLLRLGVYQLALLDAIPPHAAVHETVELTKWLGCHQWSGFVNGVLRSATRFVADEFDTQPSDRNVPTSEGRYRKLARPAFTDPRIDPKGYFEEAFSFPDWLVHRWSLRFSMTEIEQLGWWFNTVGKTCLRINQLKVDHQKALEAFRAANISIMEIAESESVLLNEPRSIEILPGFDEGWFAVQDYSATLAAQRLKVRSGETVWDVCAAPGGKTCHLAELMRNEGRIIATDVASSKLRIVEENCKRLGACIVETRLIDRNSTNLPAGPFDAILLDVPCSNTGVLGKRPEVRWRLTPADLGELNQIQRRLLNAALDRLSVEGRLVYSTCSIEPEENRLLVEGVLSSRPDAKLVEDQSFFPGQPSDGGYQALIVRSDNRNCI